VSDQVSHPTQNYRQRHSSLSLYIFCLQTGRPKIPHQIIASIPRLQSVLNFFLNGILMH
jgi:hypothetical protein